MKTHMKSTGIWRLSSKAYVSCVCYAAIALTSHHGYEVQIMDAADPFHRSGAIYSLAATGVDSQQSWKDNGLYAYFYDVPGRNPYREDDLPRVRIST